VKLYAKSYILIELLHHLRDMEQPFLSQDDKLALLSQDHKPGNVHICTYDIVCGYSANYCNEELHISDHYIQLYV